MKKRNNIIKRLYLILILSILSLSLYAISSFKDIFNVIIDSNGNLIGLKITEYGKNYMSDQDINSNEMEFHNIQTLDLNGCYKIKHISNLSSFSHLKKLDLSYCYSLTNVIISNYDLEELNISGCPNLQDEGIISLFCSNENLSEINLGGCFRLSDNTFRHLEHFINLRKLNISNCTNISYSIYFIKNLTNLRSLNISGCYNIIQDDFLKNLTKLRTLDISRCKGLSRYSDVSSSTNKIFWKSLRNLTNLEVLNLSDIDLYEGTIIFYNEEKIEFITNFSNLKVIDFSDNCCFYPDNYLSIMSNLKSLNLKGCGKTSNDTLRIISSNIANLTNLNLDSCSYISDRGINYLNSLHDLQSLDLSRCFNITNIDLRQLENLKELYIVQITNLSNIILNNEIKGRIKIISDNYAVSNKIYWVD